jgi:alpha-beta hydrolase superfamily lysophospholipase
MSNETFYFASADGLSRIFAQSWLPAGPPRATVQIIHGMSEHSGRYGEFAKYLAQNGLAVTAHDQIGHGKSVAVGQRYCFFAEQGGWQLALADIEQMRILAQEQWPDRPHFMFGHSLGSFLLRSYLLSPASAGLSGAIISGSGSISPAQLKLANLLIKMERRRLGAQGLSKLLYLAVQGGYNRQFRPIRTYIDWLSSDTDMVDDYLADPYCRKLPTVGLFDDVNKALAVIGQTATMQAMESTLPLLLISGENDPLGGNGRAVRKLYAQLKKAGCADVGIHLYPGCRHALHYEKNRQEVFADIADWLENKL